MANSREYGTTILLGLKGHHVKKVREEDKGIVVEMELVKERVSCPSCRSERLHRHGRCKQRQVLHNWSNGRKVYLELNRQRWRCRDCGRCFNEGLDMLRRYSRMTRQGEQEALWQLRQQSFSQVRRELGVAYSTLRRLLEREIDQQALAPLLTEEEIFLGIDEHSFRHQELVYTVTEVKKRMMLAILRDDRIATLKSFLSTIPKQKVKEVCIDMKEGLWRAAEAIFPKARVVVDHFHVIADSNRRMDEARRIEQEEWGNKKLRIPKKIFLVGREKLSEERRERVDDLLSRYPSLRGFYWAKEKIRELYRQESREDATRLMDNIILNLKSSNDGELIRWGNTLKRWREPILNYFDNHTTNGFTEGCNTKIKMLKRTSYGLRNVEVYWRKMLLGFVPCRACFHTI